MLQSLRITNYALIEKLEISFEDGFSSITGETGAGKSIILGALSVLLGKRSDNSVLKDKNVKSVIEAEFKIGKQLFQSLFDEHDLDFSEETLIRREILPQGKSRAFINDTPVTVAGLKAFGDILIDIHSQHHNLFLKESLFQLQVIDSYAQNEDLLKDFESAYETLKNAEKELAVFVESIRKAQDDMSYFKFRLDELQKAELKENEQTELEQELGMLENGEDVKKVLSEAEYIFENEEISLLSQLKQLSQSFEKKRNVSKDFEKFSTRLSESLIELSDISYEISRLNSNFDFDPANLTKIQDRLGVIYSLQHKFNCDSVAELLKEQNRLEKIVSQVEDSSVEQERLQKQIDLSLQKVEAIGEKLSKRREQAIKKLEPQLTQMLQPLGMPYVRFEIQQKKLQKAVETGFDEVNMLFSANKNIEMQWLGDVSSGGEISRVMLCLKAVLAKGKSLQTIIFDEIDTGTSGEIADKMGALMQKMSDDMQVIVITHLPQIAAKSKKQFKVFKTETSESTVTNIIELDETKRIEELAKMMSGENITDEAIANAKVLLVNKK